MGYQATQTRCYKPAPIAVSEASVKKSNGADGSGWARIVARERLALQSMVGVQSTDCDSLTLEPANAA